MNTNLFWIQQLLAVCQICIFYFPIQKIINLLIDYPNQQIARFVFHFKVIFRHSDFNIHLVYNHNSITTQLLSNTI